MMISIGFADMCIPASNFRERESKPWYCLVFIHEMPVAFDASKYYFTGHQHPGIKLIGKGKQSFVLPCFYFRSNHVVLPAFSTFSGKHIVEVKKNEFAYGIIDHSPVKSLVLFPTS